MMVGGLPIAVASLVAEAGSRHSGFNRCISQALEQSLRSCSHRLGCTAACGIFPDQGSNPRLLQWQVASSPLSHEGSPPVINFFKKDSYD